MATRRAPGVVVRSAAAGRAPRDVGAVDERDLVDALVSRPTAMPQDAVRVIAADATSQRLRHDRHRLLLLLLLELILVQRRTLVDWLRLGQVGQRRLPRGRVTTLSSTIVEGLFAAPLGRRVLLRHATHDAAVGHHVSAGVDGRRRRRDRPRRWRRRRRRLATRAVRSRRPRTRRLVLRRVSSALYPEHVVRGTDQLRRFARELRLQLRYAVFFLVRVVKLIRHFRPSSLPHLLRVGPTGTQLPDDVWEIVDGSSGGGGGRVKLGVAGGGRRSGVCAAAVQSQPGHRPAQRSVVESGRSQRLARRLQQGFVPRLGIAVLGCRRGPVRGRPGPRTADPRGRRRTRHSFRLAARGRAVQPGEARQERLTDERPFARRAREAGVRGVPVPPVVAHLTLVDADRATAGVAGLGVQRLEAGAAVGTRRAHDVALAAEMAFALETLEVTHVPTLTLGFRALVGEYYLNATHRRANKLHIANITSLSIEAEDFIQVRTEFSDSLP